MRRVAHPWLRFGVLVALGLCALAFVVHFHHGADDHPESCALCAAAHHGPVLVSVAAPVGPGVDSAPIPIAPVAALSALDEAATAGPRAPPLS